MSLLSAAQVRVSVWLLTARAAVAIKFWALPSPQKGLGKASMEGKGHLLVSYVNELMNAELAADLYAINIFLSTSCVLLAVFEIARGK